MMRFGLRRLAWSVVVLWAVVTLAFAATLASPVDPVEVYAGRFATPEVRAEIREEFGLDRSAPIRYREYLSGLVHGNLGVSIGSGEPVFDVLRQRLPATARLALAGVLMEVLIGVPLGILAALRPGSAIDRFVLLFSLVGALAPVFVVGYVLLYVVAYRWGLVPIGGYGGISHLLLPALTLGLAAAPWLARMTRSTMIEIANQEFMRAARARGASPRRLLLRHALPNAVNPVITMIGVDAGIFFAGVLVIEKVYAWPGIGQAAWLAVAQNDFPMIIGTVLVAAVAIVAFNLAADVANMFLDPRIRRG